MLADSIPLPSTTSVIPRNQPPDVLQSSVDETPRWVEVALVLLVAGLAFLLASFPARNTDLWMHLAEGRSLVHGEAFPGGPEAHQTWLYDVLCYGVHEALGGAGLVLVKALLVAALALVLLRVSWTGQGWWVPAFCVALALLAMSTRLLLQPATVSYFFLALALWFLRGPVGASFGNQAPIGGASNRWQALRTGGLCALFVVWVNMDHWFVLGLGMVALVWLGQVLDGDQPGGRLAAPLRQGLRFALLAAACLLNPVHIHAYALPAELTSSAGQLTSPFQSNYFSSVGLTPAGLAYFPLLGLALLSFALLAFGRPPRWYWQRFLPWLGVAGLSMLQVRTVPFFAVVTGPVLAWNLQELFARRSAAAGPQRLAWQPASRAGHLLTGLLLVLLPGLAWPGWLQVPPFGPRQWNVEVPPSLEKGAERTKRALLEQSLGAEPRGLHLSPEAAHAFAWFCPEEKGLRDDQLAAAIRDKPGSAAEWQERLRAAGINHVILYDADRGRLCTTMDRLLEDAQQWPLLYVEGYLAVFGWRDPLRSPRAASDPFQGRQLNLNHLAFRPAKDKKAPAQTSDRRPEERPWWEEFYKPLAPRPIDQDEANLHLFHAEALTRTALGRHLDAWQRTQAAALVSGAGAWAAGSPALGVDGLVDGRLRLTLLLPRPPKPEDSKESFPALELMKLTLQQQFIAQQDDTSAALLYLGIRAARRAIAINPDDAQAYLVLGECYLRLLHNTRERAWGEHLADLVQLRRAQAAAALNQAIALKPDFIQAHFNLSRLYGEMGYLDLTLEHLRTYVQLVQKKGPPPGMTAEQFQKQEATYEEELKQLTQVVDRIENRFEVASAGWKVLDKAFKAWQDGLKGKARNLLLDSDLAAFGTKGMALELELLLRTGRPKTVIEWMGPEKKPALGATYHWLRAQALAASGDYQLAKEECQQLAGTLTASPQGQEEQMDLREIMAMLAGKMILDEQAASGTLFDQLRRAHSRFDFRDRASGLAQSLRRQADLRVLRGLLALEEGEVDEAEIAFREALSFWKDEASAASGSGLDFNGRAIAQGYLELLE